MKKLNTDAPKSTVFVSILVNCYNGKPYLQECLDSIFAQTHTHFEIIFIDNQSTDGSDILAQSYGPKLRYFKTPRMMQLYEARNFGLTHVLGKAVAFLDADDYWAPDKLEKQLPLLAGSGVIYTAVQFIDGHGEPLKDYPIPPYFRGKNLTRSLLKCNFISMSSTMVQTHLLLKFGFDSYYLLLGDFDLWTNLAQVCAVDYVDEKLTFYRVYPENTSHKHQKRMPKERRHFYRHFIKRHGVFSNPEIIFYLLKAEIKATLELVKCLVHNQ